MPAWTEGDYSLVREARDSEWAFLEDLDPSCFAQRTPIILVCCSDWRRRHEIIAYTARLRGYRPDEDPETHALNWHGGPIRLVANSPVNPIPGSDRVFLAEVADAVKWTGFRDVIMYSHWPCTKAIHAGMKVRQVWESLVSAQLRILDLSGIGANVRTFFHADYEEIKPGEKRSYYLPPRRFTSWLRHARE